MRDSQTLISSYRTKYPQYSNIDDATLLSGIQKKYPQYSDVSLGSKPPWQKVLNSPAMKFAMGGGVGAGGGTPQEDLGPIAARTVSAVAGGVPQQVAENPITSAISGPAGLMLKAGGGIQQGASNLLEDINRSMGLEGGGYSDYKTQERESPAFTPTSEYGKQLAPVIDLASAFLPIPGMRGIKALNKPVFASERPTEGFFTRNFSEKNIGRKLTDLQGEASRIIPEKQAAYRGSKSKEFGKSLGESREFINSSDLNSLVDQVASKFPEQADYIQSLKSNLPQAGMSTDPIAGAQFSENPISARDIHNLLGSEVFEKGNPAAAEIYQAVLDKMPGLKEMKSAYKPIYQDIKESKKLPGIIGKIGKEKLGPEEMAYAEENAKKLGLENFLQKAIQLQNKAKKVKRNKKVLKAVEAGAGGFAGYNVLKSLFGG